MSLRLDTNLFTDDYQRLRPEIRQALLDVLSDVLEDLKSKHNFQFTPKFVYFMGSLTGANWDDVSDIDFHLGVDYSEAKDPKELENFLGLFAKTFNQQKFKIKGRDVELYFQDVHEKNATPGIYDILHDHWVKPPSDVKIEITDAEHEAARTYEDKLAQLKRAYIGLRKERPNLRAFLQTLRGYYDTIKQMRKQSILEGGEKSFGNQVFKLLRRRGLLESLTKFIQDVQGESYNAFADEQEIILVIEDFPISLYEDAGIQAPSLASALMRLLYTPLALQKTKAALQQIFAAPDYLAKRQLVLYGPTDLPFQWKKLEEIEKENLKEYGDCQAISDVYPTMMQFSKTGFNSSVPKDLRHMF